MISINITCGDIVVLFSLYCDRTAEERLVRWEKGGGGTVNGL